MTIDGVTRALPPCFTVFASQNPVEYEGTYPLPEAQLDRFLLKVPRGRTPTRRRSVPSSTATSRASARRARERTG